MMWLSRFSAYNVLMDDGRKERESRVRSVVLDLERKLGFSEDRGNAEDAV